MRKEGVQLRENDSCRKINLQVLPLRMRKPPPELSGAV